MKKGLGQHHLVDGSLCRPLIDYLEPRGQRVLEIGPGGGVLTSRLLEAGAEVIGWEVDLEWAAKVRGLLPDPRFRLVVGDALEVAWERLPAPTLVAGNLPYNVATAILQRLLPHHARISRVAVLVQKEVAERLVARAGDEAYGSLSLLVAAYARAQILGLVHPGSFRPPPKVDSAFVGFALRPPPLPEAEMPAFIALIRLAFAQRRKTLRNTLGAGWGKERAGEILGACDIPDRTRAEELGLEDFLRLYGEWGRVLVPEIRGEI